MSSGGAPLALSSSLGDSSQEDELRGSFLNVIVDEKIHVKVSTILLL